MYRLQVKEHFDAAHRLAGHRGKCSREHGHRWEVEVCLQGEQLDAINMLIDFGDVKRALSKLLEDYLDHYRLNDTLRESNPTAEFLARWVYENLPQVLNQVCSPPDSHPWHTSSVELVRVAVWESPECCVKYSPDMKSVKERDGQEA